MLFGYKFWSIWLYLCILLATKLLYGLNLIRSHDHFSHLNALHRPNQIEKADTGLRISVYDKRTHFMHQRSMRKAAWSYCEYSRCKGCFSGFFFGLIFFFTLSYLETTIYQAYFLIWINFFFIGHMWCINNIQLERFEASVVRKWIQNAIQIHHLKLHKGTSVENITIHLSYEICE